MQRDASATALDGTGRRRRPAVLRGPAPRALPQGRPERRGLVHIRELLPAAVEAIRASGAWPLARALYRGGLRDPDALERRLVQVCPTVRQSVLREIARQVWAWGDDADGPRRAAP